MSPLDPYTRFELLELLRPPAGYRFDEAIGTTFSLDLLALLVLPIGFSPMELDVGESDAVQLEPLKVLEAVRQVTDCMTILCQASQIKAGRHRQLFALLEPCVHQASAPNPKGSLHAKTWAVRYVGPEGSVWYRFISLSRNLTFDSSWDTVVCCEGEYRSDRVRPFKQSRPLRDFYDGLLTTPVHPLPKRDADRFKRFAKEIALVDFKPPEPFKDLAFFPMGFGSEEPGPLASQDGPWRIISPFLDRTFIADHLEKGDGLVSRAEAFDEIGAGPLEGIDCRVLNLPPAPEIGGGSDEEITASPQQVAPPQRVDLHAKVFVLDGGRYSTLLTGSANATNRGFTRNVEFLVGLTGTKGKVGIDAVFGATEGEGLGSMLVRYSPGEGDKGAAEQKRRERKLDDWCQRIASFPWQLEYSAGGEAAAQVILSAPGVEAAAVPANMNAVISLSGGTAGTAVPIEAALDGVAFALTHEQDLTAFLHVQAEYQVQPEPIVRRFTVPARLIGAPADRSTRMLGALIDQHGGVVNWLFLLLGESIPESVGGNDVENAGNAGNADGHPRRRGADPTGLFEYLVRAAVDTPERLMTARQAMDSLADHQENDADAMSIRDLLASLSGGAA